MVLRNTPLSRPEVVFNKDLWIAAKEEPVGTQIKKPKQVLKFPGTEEERKT